MTPSVPSRTPMKPTMVSRFVVAEFNGIFSLAQGFRSERGSPFFSNLRGVCNEQLIFLFFLSITSTQYFPTSFEQKQTEAGGFPCWWPHEVRERDFVAHNMCASLYIKF